MRQAEYRERAERARLVRLARSRRGGLRSVRLIAAQLLRLAADRVEPSEVAAG